MSVFNYVPIRSVPSCAHSISSVILYQHCQTLFEHRAVYFLSSDSNAALTLLDLFGYRQMTKRHA